MFASDENLQGQKPTDWWQKCHDVDLLWGIYKYGFGNYHILREDRKLSWFDAKSEDRQWPEVEKLTKRLKKIVAIFRNTEPLKFDSAKVEVTKSGLSERSKVVAIT